MRPYRLNSTCCVTRIGMLWWDERPLIVISKTNMKMVEGVCYMDDNRIWLHAIRLEGWTD